MPQNYKKTPKLYKSLYLKKLQKFLSSVFIHTCDLINNITYQKTKSKTNSQKYIIGKKPKNANFSYFFPFFEKTRIENVIKNGINGKLRSRATEKVNIIYTFYPIGFELEPLKGLSVGTYYTCSEGLKEYIQGYEFLTC